MCGEGSSVLGFGRVQSLGTRLQEDRRCTTTGHSSFMVAYNSLNYFIWCRERTSSRQASSIVLALHGRSALDTADKVSLESGVIQEARRGRSRRIVVMTKRGWQST